MKFRILTPRTDAALTFMPVMLMYTQIIVEDLQEADLIDKENTPQYPVYIWCCVAAKDNYDKFKANNPRYRSKIDNGIETLF